MLIKIECRSRETSYWVNVNHIVAIADAGCESREMSVVYLSRSRKFDDLGPQHVYSDDKPNVLADKINHVMRQEPEQSHPLGW